MYYVEGDIEYKGYRGYRGFRGYTLYTLNTLYTMYTLYTVHRHIRLRYSTKFRGWLCSVCVHVGEKSPGNRVRVIPYTL